MDRNVRLQTDFRNKSISRCQVLTFESKPPQTCQAEPNHLLNGGQAQLILTTYKSDIGSKIHIQSKFKLKCYYITNCKTKGSISLVKITDIGICIVSNKTHK